MRMTGNGFGEGDSGNYFFVFFGGGNYKTRLQAGCDPDDVLVSRAL